MSQVPLLAAQPVAFPPPETALDEPDGLLAAGGALTSEWLVEAYRQGIFPWFESDEDYILWWSPKHRATLVPGNMRVTRSLAKRIRNAGFRVTFDTRFADVVAACAAPRAYADGTWITRSMQDAYKQLHRQGLAHSTEIWLDDELVGGLYGVSLGSAFFGESMFSRAADASKVAFYHLQQQLKRWAFTLLDCQMMNPHLASLGVIEVEREQFLSQLSKALQSDTKVGAWCLDLD